MIALSERERLEVIHTGLEREWAEYEPHLREIQRYILPRRGIFGAKKGARGRKKHHAIFDNHATTSAQVLMAGMMSGLTRPTQPWFKLTVPRLQVAQRGRVASYLEASTKVVRDLFTRSNLYDSLPLLYLDAGVFGTGVMTVEAHAGTGLHTYVHPPGTFRIGHDEFGRLNTFHTTIPMTLLQVVERWGEEVLPTNERMRVERREGLTDVLEVHQTIRPNPDYKPGSDLPFERKYLQTFWLTTQQAPNDGIIESRGHRRFPIIPARWRRNGVNVYGDCPGMDALADVKMLQRLKAKIIAAVDKSVDPPIVAPSHLKALGVSLRPGVPTYSDQTQPGGGIRPVHDVTLRIQEALLAVEDTKRNIDKAFHTDLFRILADAQSRTQTAFEISQIVAERNTQLGPVLETLSNDTIDPLVEMGFEIAQEAGLLPEPPAELDGTPLSIEYLSVIAQAQKLSSANNYRGFFEMAAGLANVKPDVLDGIDGDKSLTELADIYGVAENVLTSEEARDEIRAARARQLAQQQALEAAQPVASAVQSLGATDAENLSQVVSRVAG